MRRLALLLLGFALAVALLRRRDSKEFVDVEFEDGSSVRLGRGIEARDLLDDVYAVLAAAS
jgi:hypothetical protein